MRRLFGLNAAQDRADPVIGQAYIIIDPSTGTPRQAQHISDLGNKGHTSLLIVPPDEDEHHNAIYLSFAPPNAAASSRGAIASFTRGTSISRSSRIYRVTNLNVTDMLAYVNRLEENVRNRHQIWGYNRALHNCSQVVETTLQQGGFNIRTVPLAVASPDVLIRSLNQQAGRPGLTDLTNNAEALSEIRSIKGRATRVLNAAPFRPIEPRPTLAERLTHLIRPITTFFTAMRNRPRADPIRNPPRPTQEAAVEMVANPMFAERREDRRDPAMLAAAPHAVVAPQPAAAHPAINLADNPPAAGGAEEEGARPHE